MQKDVDDWVQQFDPAYWPPLSIMAAISEETGELAREINDRYGGRKKKQEEENKELGNEITDLIFNCICLANSHDIDLDEAWRRKMDKCYNRDNDRYEKKD